MLILRKLCDSYNLSGLKTSFEDEGADLSSANEVISLAHFVNLPATVKIGGAEARSDIQNCILYGVDNIVAPMIETSFAASKFEDACKTLLGPNSSKNLYINIETVTSCENIKEIIEKVSHFAKGIVVGRSDLSKSLGLTKEDTNSDVVFDITKKVLIEAKKNNLETTIGGNLNSKSLDFIKLLHKENLLDRVETRLVICNVNENLLNNYQNFLDLSIELERQILEKRLFHVNAQRKEIEKRIKTISGRTKFLKEVKEAEKRILVVDFDKVIHDMTMGFHDGTIYGNPVKGCHEALQKLAKKYKIIIYTCKANPNRPLIDGKTGTELIEEWLVKNNLKNYISDITFNKPNAIAYIDDKAIEFKTWEDCLLKLKQKKIL